MKMRPNIVNSSEFSLEANAICNDILGHVMAQQSDVFFPGHWKKNKNSRLFARSGHMVQSYLCRIVSYIVELLIQRNLYQSSPTFICFESPFVSLASQRNINSVPCDRNLQKAYWICLSVLTLS